MPVILDAREIPSRRQPGRDVGFDLQWLRKIVPNWFFDSSFERTNINSSVDIGMFVSWQESFNLSSRRVIRTRKLILTFSDYGKLLRIDSSMVLLKELITILVLELCLGESLLSSRRVIRIKWLTLTFIDCGKVFRIDSSVVLLKELISILVSDIEMFNSREESFK